MNDTKYTELENGLAKDKVQGLFDQLRPKAIWYPEKNLVWIKSFVKRQGTSPKFLVAVGRCLEVINNKKIIKEFINYNKNRHEITIPYRYPIDTLPIPYQSSSSSSSSSSSTSNSKSISNKGGGGVTDLAHEIWSLLTDLPERVDSLGHHKAITQALSALGTVMFGLSKIIDNQKAGL